MVFKTGAEVSTGSARPPVQRIALFYGHVASNIGDLAINTGTLQLIADRFPGVLVDIVLLDAADSKFMSSSLSSFDTHLTIRLLYLRSDAARAQGYLRNPAGFLHDCGLLERPDAILLASGEHLFDYGHDENAKSLFWRLLPGFVAASLGIPLVQLPATFGPFERPASRALIAAFLQSCDAWSVRDAASQAYLAEAFPDLHPGLHLDPAFMIAATPKDLAHKPAAALRTGIAMRSEGWGIRLDRKTRSSMTAAFRADDQASSLAFQITAALMPLLLRKEQAEVVIFVQTAADKLLAERLLAVAEALGAADRVTLYTPACVEDYLAQLAQLDRVIASRFHAIILALVTGTPALGVYFEDHGHKMPGLFTLLCAPDLCTKVAADGLKDQVDHIIAGLGQSRIKTMGIVKRLDKLRVQTADWFEVALRSHGKADGKTASLAVFRAHLSELALILADAARPTEEDLPALSWAEAQFLSRAVQEARVIYFEQDGCGVDLATNLPEKRIFVSSENLAQVRQRRRSIASARQAPGDNLAGLMQSSPSISGVTFCLRQSSGDETSLWQLAYFRQPDLIVMRQPEAISGLSAALQAGATMQVLVGSAALVTLAPLIHRWQPQLQRCGNLVLLRFGQPPWHFEHGDKR